MEVPPPTSRAYVRFVRLEVNNCPGCRYLQVMAVNGLTNFNLYYSVDGLGFFSGGTYKVTYLGADQTTSYGYDVVTYSPNSHHTNGVEVRPFNNPPATPRGIHGTV